MTIRSYACGTALGLRLSRHWIVVKPKPHPKPRKATTRESRPRKLLHQILQAIIESIPLMHHPTVQNNSPYCTPVSSDSTTLYPAQLMHVDRCNPSGDPYRVLLEHIPMELVLLSSRTRNMHSAVQKWFKDASHRSADYMGQRPVWARQRHALVPRQLRSSLSR